MRFSDRLRALFGIRNADTEAFFDELADLLVEGDLGAGLAFEIVDSLRDTCRKSAVSDPDEIRHELRHLLSAYCRGVDVTPVKGTLNVFLLLGVNGVGKTTSCAKLARYYSSRGLADRVILAAGDTFRAAAIDQIKVHGERLGMRVVAQSPGSDPGAVLFDAIDAAKAQGAELVIADTAGRMHTRQDLVRELGKIDKIVSSRAAGASYRRFIVLDATTGQNGLRQAETFKAAVHVDGAILTKMDSTAKGGLVMALSKELGIPTAFIGKGEGYDDLEPFVADSFLDSFLGPDSVGQAPGSGKRA